MSSAVTAAYLGPANSYTHQAALALLPSSLTRPTTTLIPYTSIAAAYESRETYAVLPLENTIFGVVQETLGCLLSSEGEGDDEDEDEKKGARWRIVQTFDKRVEHCLVVSSSCSDEQLDKIAWVASHEQALGQCAKFIKQRLPCAQLVKTPSTAQAAEALALLSSRQKLRQQQQQQNDTTTISYPSSSAHPAHPVCSENNGQSADEAEDELEIIPKQLQALPGAAICSEAAVEGLEGLRITRKGVQDVAGEFLVLEACKGTAANSDRS
ncbi:hypothetical protein QFC22_001348 [Naganishia vaughanmartiniae]|uniref:Uncharacterized protein n=1 Tax=Naganishia vaughanmartiniae TaxID=1424756 RepID=A0ACC2XHT8_9TREE|nr:hypothetical protein QFC22_001348 [Naganishia vaughanmartiniae]